MGINRLEVIKIVTWLSDWAKRIKVTIDKDQFASTEANFAIKVEINSSSGQSNQDLTPVFDEVGGNYLKIAVTDDNDNQLYVEVDEWWSGSEQARIWVKVVSVSNSVDTDIYLYYDNSKVDNTTYVGIVDSTPAENVWDSDFMMVQHMSDITTSTIKDSSTNDNDGAKKGANDPIEATGLIGYGQDFDETNYIDCGNDASLNVDNVTVEVLIKPGTNDQSDNMRVMSKRAVAQTSNYLMAHSSGATNNKVRFLRAVGGAWKVATTTTDINNTSKWYYIVGKWDGSDVYIYVDGSQEDITSAIGAATNNSSTDLYISARPADAQYYNGIIGEVRVSDVSRSANWIASMNENVVDNVCTFGAEEEYSGIVPLSMYYHLMGVR